MGKTEDEKGYTAVLQERDALKHEVGLPTVTMDVYAHDLEAAAWSAWQASGGRGSYRDTSLTTKERWTLIVARVLSGFLRNKVPLIVALEESRDGWKQQATTTRAHLDRIYLAVGKTYSDEMLETDRIVSALERAHHGGHQ